MCATKHIFLHLLVFVFYEIVLSIPGSNFKLNRFPGNATKTKPSNSCTGTFKDDIVTFDAPTQENYELTFTGKSLEAVVDCRTTRGKVTGGSIGNSTFTHYKTGYYWNTCGNKITFQVHIIYFNKEQYSTFELALKNRGVFISIIPIEANGCIDNPEFAEFEKKMHKIEKPGDCTPLNSKASFDWFKNFPKNVIYASFTGTIDFEKTGEHWEDVTINKFPLKPILNFMSRQQFQRTFGVLCGNSGKSVDIPPPKIKATGPVIIRKGFLLRPILG